MNGSSLRELVAQEQVSQGSGHNTMLSKYFSVTVILKYIEYMDKNTGVFYETNL